MLNIVSVPLGLVALLIGLVGLIPLLGWLNWIALAIAVVGVTVGSLSAHKIGRNLNIAVTVLAALRLFLGGGVF